MVMAAEREQRLLAADRVIASELSLADLLPSISRVACELVSARWAALHLVGDREGSVYLWTEGVSSAVAADDFDGGLGPLSPGADAAQLAPSRDMTGHSEGTTTMDATAGHLDVPIMVGPRHLADLQVS